VTEFKNGKHQFYDITENQYDELDPAQTPRACIGKLYIECPWLTYDKHIRKGTQYRRVGANTQRWDSLYSVRFGLLAPV